MFSINRPAALLTLAALFGLPDESAAAQTAFARNYDNGARELSPRDQLEVQGGGLLVCGDSYLTGTAQSRPYLMRLTAAGDVLWCKEYEVLPGFHRAEAITEAFPGIYVILADVYGVQKPALFAVNAAGDFLLGRGYTMGSAQLTMDEMLRTSDGGFLLVGSTFRDTTGSDVAVLKLGPLGEVVWYRELVGGILAPLFGSNDFAVGAVEALDASGYYVLGSLESDAYLAKLDLDGNVVFERTYRLPGASLFERTLGFFEKDGGPGTLIAIADFANDRFPLILQVDSAGNLLSSTAGSLGMSATKALPTADGGFAIAGSSLITPGAQGLRLARYDSTASLQWAFQYDVMLTFATINPPANVIQAADGGFLLSVAALAGLDPVQHAVRATPAGANGCETPLAGPFPFTVESSTTVSSIAAPVVVSVFLTFAQSDLDVVTSVTCIP